jgi:hypothetical protein
MDKSIVKSNLHFALGCDNLLFVAADGSICRVAGGYFVDGACCTEVDDEDFDSGNDSTIVETAKRLCENDGAMTAEQFILGD